MLITRETDYALRILRALAHGDKLTATELSENEQIPLAFAYKIIKKLEKQGLVTIFRGTAGGSQLRADLTQVSLYDFMDMMGENLSVATCTDLGHVCQWVENHTDTVCHAHCLLHKLESELASMLKQYSLQEVLFGS